MQAPLALLMWRGPEDLSMAAPATVPFAYQEPAAPEASAETEAGLAVPQATAEGQAGADEPQQTPLSSKVCNCGSGITI